jgi:hypothetical protein
MRTRIVPQARWREILDSLTRVYEGSTASLEVLDPELGAQYEIEEQPFRGITYDASGIGIDFTTKDGAHLWHRIPDPKQLEVEEGDDGLVAAFLIQAERRNVLRLHSPIASKLLPPASE